MLAHTKWKGQDPIKVIKKKSFKKWLLEKVQKATINFPKENT